MENRMPGMNTTWARRAHEKETLYEEINEGVQTGQFVHEGIQWLFL